MKHPNLLIVMPDELRQQAVGITKTDPVISPHIDAFSKESLTLTNALSNCPICSPARAMLFSGKYPLSNGVIDNCYSAVSDYNIELKAEEYCLSDALQEAGYSQGYIGKYHLDLPKEEEAAYTEGWRGNPDKGGTLWDAYTPVGARRHGYDFWYSYGCCDQHLSPHYWKNEAKVNERLDINEWSVKHETDVAIAYLKNTNGEFRKKDTPFSLFIAYNPPHMPFHLVPEHYKAVYADQSPNDLLNRPEAQIKSAQHGVASYFAAITGVDEQFGRLLNTLKEQGLDENTLVIFMSDHGEMLGSHGRMGKNAWYNEAFLIPFILRWKGTIKPRTDDLLFNLPDLMPTLLSLMGLTNKIPNDLEGIDRSALFLGQQTKRPTSGFYLTAQPLFPEERRGIKTLKHTFVVIRNRTTGTLFYVLHDNKKDPYQLENIADQHPLIVTKTLKELEHWLIKTNDPWINDNILGEKLKQMKTLSFKLHLLNLITLITDFFTKKSPT
ncbi:MAG: sulfatase [Cocleimonas sp.]|nr:sulfatase [Cocleimonas sp.]